MMEPKVDIELQDMAEGLGTDLRRLMAGVLNGRFSRVEESDLVRGDKGDPLFFRVEESRAYSIFGSELDRVEKDMSTVERMSRGALPNRRMNESDDGQEATQSASESLDRAPAPQPSDDTQQEEPPQESTSEKKGQESQGWSWGQVLFTTFLGGMVAYSFGQQTERSTQQRNRLEQQEWERAYQEGYTNFQRGFMGNPYQPGTVAAQAYQRGQDEARRAAARQKLERNGLMVQGTRR